MNKLESKNTNMLRVTDYRLQYYVKFIILNSLGRIWSSILLNVWFYPDSHKVFGVNLPLFSKYLDEFYTHHIPLEGVSLILERHTHHT
jgi:hypothetical protein